MLINSGLIYKVNSVIKPNIPLIAYDEPSKFKLYLFDIGLLSTLSNLSASCLLEKNTLFTEFNGALTENYVLNELIKLDKFNVTTYMPSSSKMEIDFLIDNGENVIPIKVKANINLKAKSLITFKEIYKPSVLIRTSLSKFMDKSDLKDIPLYLIDDIEKFFD